MRSHNGLLLVLPSGTIPAIRVAFSIFIYVSYKSRTSPEPMLPFWLCWGSNTAVSFLGATPRVHFCASSENGFTHHLCGVSRQYRAGILPYYSRIRWFHMMGPNLIYNHPQWLEKVNQFAC